MKQNVWFLVEHLEYVTGSIAMPFNLCCRFCIFWRTCRLSNDQDVVCFGHEHRIWRLKKKTLMVGSWKVIMFFTIKILICVHVLYMISLKKNEFVKFTKVFFFKRWYIYNHNSKFNSQNNTEPRLILTWNYLQTPFRKEKNICIHDMILKFITKDEMISETWNKS